MGTGVKVLPDGVEEAGGSRLSVRSTGRGKLGAEGWRIQGEAEEGSPRRAEVGVRCKHPWAMEEGAARVLGPDVPLQQEGKETPSELGTREREGTTGSSCFF